jgi:hypothetical protein
MFGKRDGDDMMLQDAEREFLSGHADDMCRMCSCDPVAERKQREVVPDDVL